VTGAVGVGPHRAAGRIESPVEEQSFYSLVIVEVLHVPQVRDRGPHMRVQAPASMSRAESASDQLYSPAATSGRTCARTTARPARSCDENRLLEPGHADRAELIGDPHRLARGVAAVGIHGRNRRASQRSMQASSSSVSTGLVT